MSVSPRPHQSAWVSTGENGGDVEMLVNRIMSMSVKCNRTNWDVHMLRRYKHPHADLDRYRLKCLMLFQRPLLSLKKKIFDHCFICSFVQNSPCVHSTRVNPHMSLIIKLFCRIPGMMRTSLFASCLMANYVNPLRLRSIYWYHSHLAFLPSLSDYDY